MGGAGIARHEGMVIFVFQAAPGDLLKVRITHKKKNFAEAEIIEILEPGPSRRSPPCPVAHQCGGCNWQHIHENEQRKQKEQIVLDTLKKFNRDLQFEYLGIEASPLSLRYRNRIQPKYENGKFGFFARGSHSIVPVKDCLITEELITREFQTVHDLLKAQRPRGLQRLEMYLDKTGQVRHSVLDSPDESIGFSQVNRFQNQSLIDTVLEWCDPAPKNILELYAGSGNFTFPLNEKFPQSPITAVELNPKLVKRGQEQAAHLPVHFVESTVEKALAHIPSENMSLILLDPPRSGTSEDIMTRLALSRSRQIIYISCHPVSLARDLQWFFAAAQQHGLKARLTKLKCFEMFPQTDHVETIAELRVDSE